MLLVAVQIPYALGVCLSELSAACRNVLHMLRDATLNTLTYTINTLPDKSK